MVEYLWFVGTCTGYAGSDQYEAILHPATDMEDEDLSQVVWEMALEQAQSYGIERYCGTCEACESCDYDECEDQEEGIEGWAEFYSPEKHDGKAIAGHSFLSEHEGCKYNEELKAYFVEEKK